MKNHISIWAILSALTFYSCGQEKEYKSASADMLQKEAAANEERAEEVENPADRKIIKEGEISFETSNINETKSLIVKTVEELNGYLANDNAYSYSSRIEHRLVIRVPSDKFDLLLKKISEQVEKLNSKNINVLDVTEEYIDIEARIKTKKELQDRYKELLKQATKIDDILLIEKEIGQLQTEIESVEGRMKYLKDRISLSTLTATYYQKTSSAFGFSSEFVSAIENGWDALLWFFIGMAHLWAFILLGAAVIFFFIWRRRRKKKNTAQH